MKLWGKILRVHKVINSRTTIRHTCLTKQVCRIGQITIPSNWWQDSNLHPLLSSSTSKWEMTSRTRPQTKQSCFKIKCSKKEHRVQYACKTQGTNPVNEVQCTWNQSSQRVRLAWLLDLPAIQNWEAIMEIKQMFSLPIISTQAKCFKTISAWKECNHWNATQTQLEAMWGKLRCET